MPYVGIWMRITHRFGPRRSEWLASILSYGFGTQLILTPDIMEGPQWVLFKSIMSPASWGTFLALNGAICLAALFVNGARPNITPKIRMVASALRLFIWAGMWLVFAFGGYIGLWITLYTALFAFEWSNLIEASKDTGQAYANARISRHLVATGHTANSSLDRSGGDIGARGSSHPHADIEGSGCSD